MKEKQLENDAFVAYMSAPQAELEDYLRNGLTVENTLLLSADEYKSIPSVLKIFTDEEGVFNNDAFMKIYKAAEAKYLDLSDQEALNNLLEWSPTSRYAPIGGKKETYEYTPESFNNPTKRSKSITGLNQEGPEKYTEKELALMGKIWDSDKGEWKSGTAEGQSLWDKITGETLVYAKYTEDGELLNPVTGQIEFHRAGEWMKDEDGNYFTRTIKTEELGRNEVVNLGDIITKEDSWMNKINPLDSDERKKSLPGVVAKSALLAIPWLIPGINTYYTALQVATSLVGLGATFAKAGEKALLGLSNTGFGKGATAVENWFRKFSVGVSEENAQNFFSLENLGQQMADVFGQLHRLQAVAKLSNIFYRSLPTEKLMEKMSGESIMKIMSQIEKRNKLGSSLSLGYMGLESAANVYNDALNAGYDERTAGLTALASAASLYGIMNFNETTRGIGNWFLKSATGYDHEITRTPVIKCAKKLYKKAESAMNSALKDHNYTEMNNFFGDMWANTKSWLLDTLIAQGEGVWKNMIVEGVEEVSEEAILDTVKGIVDTLSALGFTEKEGSFGGWSNVFSKEGLARYLQTAAGGAFGGALFELQRTKIEPAIKSFITGKKVEEKINDKDIVDLILQGRAEDLRKELLNLKSIFNTKKGATGIVEEDGTIHDFKANGLKTLADMIVDELLARVNAIEKTVESVIPRTYFGTLSNFDERRFRENLQFNGIDLEPVFFADFNNAVVEAVESWGRYKTTMDRNSETKKRNEENSSNPPVDPIDEKAFKEDFERKLKRTKSYFDPANLAYRQVLGKVLTSGQIAYGLSGGFGARHILNKENWMKIFHPEIEEKYEDLKDRKEGDPYFLVTKLFIDEEYDKFYSAWGNALSDPEDLAKRMRLLTELYMNASSMLEPILKMTDLQYKTERMKIINEYKPAEIYLKYIDLMDLESLFGTQQFKELQKLSEEDKEEVIKERRQQVANSMLREALATARNARLVHFAEIALRNPFAFSARERVNFDLAGALEKRGVLTFTDDFDSDTKELLKAYINLIAQDSGLVVFNKETLEALLRLVYRSFFNSDNLFVKAILQHTLGNLRGLKLEDVEISGDSEEEGSSRKALIDLVSPVLEEWDFSKLDSDDFYDDKIKAQIAYYKTANAKEQDTTGITNPDLIVKVLKLKLEEIAYDSQHPITILGVSDFPAGISHSDLDELNTLAEKIFSEWQTASFKETKDAMKLYYTLKHKMLSGVTAEKTIELALLNGIEDLIGTDTVIDNKLLDLLYISLSGEIEPELLSTIAALNLILPVNERISISDESVILENIEKIDLSKLVIPSIFRESDIDTLLDLILPTRNARNIPISIIDGEPANSMSILHKKIVSTILGSIPLEKALSKAYLDVDELYEIIKNKEKEILGLIKPGSTVLQYVALKNLLDSFDPSLEEEIEGIKEDMRKLEPDANVSEYLKLVENLQADYSHFNDLSKIRDSYNDQVELAQEAKEQCLRFVNKLRDELIRYLKIVKGKTIIKTEDPVIEMLKLFYRIIHGNEQGETAIDKLATLERKVRLSDITGDSLSLSEDEKAALDDIIETTSFISYIVDGAVKWGDTSLDTLGQNINEVWRNYEETFGDKEKAKKIIILEAKDGITVLKYLASINLRARDLKALYAELNKSKSLRYEEKRVQEVSSKIKFLKSGIIRRFHVFGSDDEEVDLLEGVTEELLNAPDSAQTKLELELIVATNLHKYYELKKLELGTSTEEDFEKQWAESLISSLMKDTDQSNPNSKIKINDPNSTSARARLYLMTYSWDTISYDKDYVLKISVPGIALWLTLLAKTSPKLMYELLSDVYSDSNISPRIDLENALLAMDFALSNSSLCNALEEAIVNVKKQIDPNYIGGPAYSNIYTLFGTGGSGKTLLMQLLSKHYGDTANIRFSAILLEKVDDLVSASESFGMKREGKKLSEYFSKLDELNETFETALIAAAEYLNENLYDKTSTFIGDTGSLDTTIGDLSIKYKDGSLTPDNKSAIFTVKSNDVEFDIRIILPVGKSLITIDHVYVDPSKVSSDIVADNSLKDSILFMDEITQLSPYQWAAILKLSAENNFKVIGAGDPVLKGWETKKSLTEMLGLSFGKITQSMEKYNMFTLGNLFGAWRADNTSLLETVDHLYNGLYKYLIEKDDGEALFVDDDFENSRIVLQPGLTGWKSVIEDLRANYYTFTYTLNSGIEDFPFLGTYMPLSKEAETLIFESINNSKAKTKAIIVNDDADIEKVKKDFPEELIKDWEILHLSEILGKEFDYTVLYQLTGNENKIQSSRELFTALTRAKKGQVIIQTSPVEGRRDPLDLFDVWKIDQSIIKYSSNIKPYATESRDNFANNRVLEILTLAENILELEFSIEEPEEEKEESEKPVIETREDEHAIDEHAVEKITKEIEEPSTSSAEAFLRGADVDKRGKKVSETWSEALEEAGVTDRKPIGIGDWYTRLGVSAHYLYDLKTGESYFTADHVITDPKDSTKRTIDQIIEELGKKVKKGSNLEDLYGFAILLQNKDKIEAGKEVFNEFIKAFPIQSTMTFKDLINLFESFKTFSYERSSNFLNIFFILRTFDEDYDYAFRKINDALLNPFCSTGVVYTYNDEGGSPKNVYITTGAVNQESLLSTVGSIQSDIPIIYHRKEKLDKVVKDIKSKLKDNTNRQNVVLELPGNSGGIYLVTCGVNLRFGSLYRERNKRFGDFSYDRIDLDTLKSLNYEILSYLDIFNLVKNIHAGESLIERLFKKGEGVYIPSDTDILTAKKDFIDLTNLFRWAGIDLASATSYSDFYKDRWILIRKKGLAIPTLTRVSIVSDEFSLKEDPKYKHFTGKSKLLTKYKHKLLINGILYACATEEEYNNFKDFEITEEDLINQTDIPNVVNDKGLFTEDCLTRIENYKNKIIEIVGRKLTDPDLKNEFKNLLDSYIARMKWNILWSKYGSKLIKTKKYSNITPLAKALKLYLGVDPSSRSIKGIKDLIISWNNHRSKIGNIIDAINKDKGILHDLSNYFYENASLHINHMNDLSNSNIKIVVEYVNEGTRSFVNFEEYESGLLVGKEKATPANPVQKSIIASESKYLLNFLLDNIFQDKELKGFYEYEKQKEFEEKVIKILVNTYTGKNLDEDSLTEDDWKKVIERFLGFDSESKEKAFNADDSMWTIIESLFKLKMEGIYEEYDEIPEFTRKFIDKNSIPDGKVPISKWTTFWKLPFPLNIIKSLFKDFNKNCEYILQDSDIITLLSNLFVDNKLDSFRRGLNAWGQSMFQKDPVLLDVKDIKCNE